MSKLVEEWRDIAEYEGLYQVSDWGRVKSLSRWHSRKEKILKGCLSKGGYLRVILCKDNFQKNKSVHRLVAETFIPNPENKPQVGHLKALPDGTEDKTANEVWNLAWMTPLENNIFGNRLERVAKANKGKTIPQEQIDAMSKPILQYDLDGNFIREWKSIAEAKRERMLLNERALRNGRTSNGFLWRYKNNTEINLKIEGYSKNTIHILQIDLNGIIIKEWDSAYAAAKTLGIDNGSIRHCCNGRGKTVGGYIWKYA